jgi:hypothetical protein
MTETNLTTPFYRYKNAQLLSDELKTGVYYFFGGDHLDHSNSEIQDVHSSVHDTLVSTYENMIFGKKITNTDIKFVVRKILYDPDTVYDMYDDEDSDLETSDFYVIVNEGSFYHYWKCLDNNQGANSISTPSFVAGANTELYQTADGYRWKYMTSVDTATVDRFVTSNFFPIVSNTEVADNAINGAIDVIKIENQGARYDNYLDGTFRGTDLRINGNTFLYNLSNSVVATTNGFYTGCLLYISGGTGLGQYTLITDYVANSTGNIIEIAEEFNVSPLNGTTYEIRPNVLVLPIGPAPSENVVARGLVNSVNSNSIYRVEILNRGADIVQASAVVVANDILGISNTADVRVIYGPHGGHGYWSYQELFCKDLEVSVTLPNTMIALLPPTNKYQQVGILGNPLFANVNLHFSSPTGLFSTGETLYQFTKAFLNSNVTVNTSNCLIKCNTANWILQVQADDYLVLSSSDGTQNELAQVNTVVNATAFLVKEIPSIIANNAIVYKANLQANSIITSIDTANSIFVDNCSSLFATSAQVIGADSGSLASISSIIRNDAVKSFSTFIELDKYIVNVLSGAFTENEVVTQSGTSNAVLFSIDGSGGNANLYMSNFTGPKFDTGNLLVGNTSGALASVQNVFSRELVYGSGQVMYLENIDPVTRSNNQNEQFQFILRF